MWLSALSLGSHVLCGGLLLGRRSPCSSKLALNASKLEFEASQAEQRKVVTSSTC